MNPGTSPSAPPEYITTSELCARLGICRKTVTNHQLTRFALRVGVQWRYNWVDVLQHYARRSTAATR